MRKNLLYENLPMTGFNPIVLNCHSFIGKDEFIAGQKLPARYVRDYELEFFFDSEGSMYIDDKLIPVHKGDVVFRRPGQHTQAIMPYSCYFIALDLANTLRTHEDWYNTCEWDKVEVEFQTYYTNNVLDKIPTIFHPQNEEKYCSLFDLILKEYVNPSYGGEIILKSYALNLIYQLYQDSCNPVMTMLNSPYGKIIKKALDYINDNINRKLSLKQLSDISELSPNYFHKIFTETMSVTPNDYITSVKLNKAKDLLLRTNLQIYNIADQCGFDNVSYFSYLFKKTFYISPLDYRNRHSYVNMV